MPFRWSRLTVLPFVVCVGVLSACKNDQGINELRFEKVAVATGDFDQVEDALNRAGVAQEVYEGYTQASVYDPEADPQQNSLKIEALFHDGDENGNPILYTYDAVFLNSGARGFGSVVYNDVDAPDDGLVSDPVVVTEIADFTARSRLVVASDWTYDLVEAAWPDQIQFLNEIEGLDSAQVGISPSVIGTVTDTDMADALGADQVELNFDFSYWAVMVDAGPEANVHVRGDLEYRGEDGEGSLRLQGVPLLVSFNTDGGGKVIYSAFSWRAQTQQVTDLMLASLIDGFDAGKSSVGGTDG